MYGVLFCLYIVFVVFCFVFLWDSGGGGCLFYFCLVLFCSCCFVWFGGGQESFK